MPRKQKLPADLVLEPDPLSAWVRFAKVAEQRQRMRELKAEIDTSRRQCDRELKRLDAEFWALIADNGWQVDDSGRVTGPDGSVL